MEISRETIKDLEDQLRQLTFKQQDFQKRKQYKISYSKINTKKIFNRIEGEKIPRLKGPTEGPLNK